MKHKGLHIRMWFNGEFRWVSIKEYLKYIRDLLKDIK